MGALGAGKDRLETHHRGCSFRLRSRIARILIFAMMSLRLGLMLSTVVRHLTRAGELSDDVAAELADERDQLLVTFHSMPLSVRNRAYPILTTPSDLGQSSPSRDAGRTVAKNM